MTIGPMTVAHLHVELMQAVYRALRVSPHVTKLVDDNRIYGHIEGPPPDDTCIALVQGEFTLPDEDSIQQHTLRARTYGEDRLALANAFELAVTQGGNLQAPGGYELRLIQVSLEPQGACVECSLVLFAQPIEGTDEPASHE